MSLLDTDPKLLKIVAKIQQRPELPLNDMMGRALAILREVRSPKPRSAEIIAARSRLSDGRTKLIDIKITILAEESLIRGALKDTELYLQSKFLSYLGSIRNQGGRDATVGTAVLPITKRLRKLESARERVEEIVKDLDQRAYAIKDTIEAIRFGEREA